MASVTENSFMSLSGQILVFRASFFMSMAIYTRKVMHTITICSYLVWLSVTVIET